MNRTTWFQRRRQPKRRAARARPQVELLETRNLLSSGFTLTPLVQVSDPSPLGSFLPSGGTTFKNSDVEPQIAVDPLNSGHAVAVWQQDLYSGSGARALVASFTDNANDPLDAVWDTPAAIPGFDGSLSTPPYHRHIDPWACMGPNA